MTPKYSIFIGEPWCNFRLWGVNVFWTLCPKILESFDHVFGMVLWCPLWELILFFNQWFLDLKSEMSRHQAENLDFNPVTDFNFLIIYLSFTYFLLQSLSYTFFGCPLLEMVTPICTAFWGYLDVTLCTHNNNYTHLASGGCTILQLLLTSTQSHFHQQPNSVTVCPPIRGQPPLSFSNNVGTQCVSSPLTL